MGTNVQPNIVHQPIQSTRVHTPTTEPTTVRVSPIDAYINGYISELFYKIKSSIRSTPSAISTPSATDNTLTQTDFNYYFGAFIEPISTPSATSTP